jgi:hypothetical protein
MSYPEPRYLGASGEVSATYRRADHEPELTFRETGNTVHYLATGASTDGLFGLYRWDMGPLPSGPKPHFHRSISESFFVLSGKIRNYDGRAWIDTAPGAPREAYLEVLAEFAVSGPPSDEELAAFYLRHDNVWL